MENQDQQTPPTPELSISDLQNIRILINMAVRRGAFGAEELSSVGAVFDRLNAFLNAVVQPGPTENAPQTDSTEQS